MNSRIDMNISKALANELSRIYKAKRVPNKKRFIKSRERRKKKIRRYDEDIYF